MKLEQYRTLWGVLDLTDGEAARSPVHTFDEAIAEFANEGYDGVELPLKLALHIGIDHVKALLIKYHMGCTIQVQPCTSKCIDENSSFFENQKSVDFNALTLSLIPSLIRTLTLTLILTLTLTYP